MKKIYTLLAGALMIAGAASAQKVIDIETTLVSPATGSTVTVGTAFPFSVVFKNKGTGTIVPADTLLFTFTGAGTTYYLTGRNKAPNDTILLSTSLNFTSATNGTLNFCVAALMGGSSITDSDTSNNRNCHSITIAGGSTGIVNLSASMEQKAENLNIFPNPATGTINLDYKARNSSALNARVIDITGREVMSVNFGRTYVGQSGYKLDISNLTTGMYFVELRQDGVRAVGRVSKQ